MCSVPLTDSNDNVDVVTAYEIDTFFKDVQLYIDILLQMLSRTKPRMILIRKILMCYLV